MVVYGSCTGLEHGAGPVKYKKAILQKRLRPSLTILYSAKTLSSFQYGNRKKCSMCVKWKTGKIVMIF